MKYIVFGKWEIDVWYTAPLPEEFSSYDHVYFCERCFKYMKTEFTWIRHRVSCIHFSFIL